MQAIFMHIMAQDNLQGGVEVKHHAKFFGEVVKIVKGKKSVGFVGEVFWLSRAHYGTNPWIGFSTRVGIRNEDGVVCFTSSDNIEIKQ